MAKRLQDTPVHTEMQIAEYIRKKVLFYNFPDIVREIEFLRTTFSDYLYNKNKNWSENTSWYENYLDMFQVFL